MHGKFLFALAACLPLALAGCGGGGTPASSTASPSGNTGGSGTRTPAAALDAAKAAVDNADSERTEAAVRRARGALSEAVEKAEAALAAARTDLNAAQAALKEAQDYRAEQAAVLDGLQPTSDLAAAETASATLALEASAALNAAKTAMARATRLRTEAAIRAARSALSDAVDKAEESLNSMTAIVRSAEAALKEAQDYRADQTEVLDSIPFTRSVAPPSTIPSSPPDEFRVTHVERSYVYNLERNPDYRIRKSPSTRTFDETHWRDIRDDARRRENGFSLFTRRNTVGGTGAHVNGITIAQKTSRETHYFPEDSPLRTPSGGIPVLSYTTSDDIVGLGDYSAFRLDFINERLAQDLWRFSYGQSSAFGERSVVAPGWIRPQALAHRFVYRGAMAGVKHEGGEERGEAFTGAAVLTYRPGDAGDKINLDLREWLGQGNYGPWRHTTDMSVDNDGSFSDASNSVKGNFYGPNWEESAGIVQTDDVYGAWLVHRPYRFFTESDTGGGSYVFGNVGLNPSVDFVQ